MDLKYAYLNTRVKAMESKLLPEALFKQLIVVKTIDEMIELLEETNLKRSFVDASINFKGIALIEEALRLELVSSLKLIKKYLPKKHNDLFELVFSEFHAQNLKTIVAKKALGQDVSLNDLVLLNGSSEYDSLIKADLKSFVSLIELDANSDSAKAAAKDLPIDYRVLLKDIDKAFYAKISSLAGKGDHPQTKQIIFSRLEFLNAMMILRSKKLGVEVKTFFSNAFINSLKENGFDTAVEKMIQHYKLSSDEEKIAKNSLALLEVIVEQKIVNKILKETRLSVMSFSSVIGFVYLKQVELGNIRKIAYSKLYSMPELNDYVFAINA
ncbi:V-type ATPase subunit [Candidatus Micrarchaeota archaeon]|nr:V-type ATPase subunit [Candidatus Micrarchaeota archaeon]